MLILLGLFFNFNIAVNNLTNNDILIELYSGNNIIYDKVELDVKITNFGKKSIAILKPNLNFPMHFNNNTWDTHIYYRDSIRKTFSTFFSVDYYISEGEYILLNSQKSYVFKFNIDFTTIQGGEGIKSEIFDKASKTNNDYGFYKVQIVYNDPLRKVKNAVKGRVESNWVYINYRKQ